MSDTYQGRVPSRAETVVGMLGDAIRRWADRLAFTRFMQGDPAEANRLAQDLNIDKRTLLDVVRKGHGSAALLARRMGLLGIDAEAIRKREPAVVQDLSRCCSLCGSKPRCARDMVREPQGESWRTYCPNEPTLETLRPAAAGEKAA
ncbi:MAG: hypothetical protein K2Z80_19230 [Xanthobacteraceae bacterium]|nr:hypothetical protein [Xanthobacteraceae bacterium]